MAKSGLTDPVIFLEYAIDVAQACRERQNKTVVVSAGYISPEPRIEFFRHALSGGQLALRPSRVRFPS